MESADKGLWLGAFWRAVCGAGCRALLILLLVTHGVEGQAPVDLNRATVEQLEVLPSIGPVLANRIIEYRRRHGPFQRARDVVAVRGMSARRYRRIAHLLTVK